jgi:two-component system, response regulator FlrC
MADFDFRTLADVERQHILETLRRCNGNRTFAAKVLEISVRGLRIKLHDYAQAGIVVPSATAAAKHQPLRSQPNFG